MHFAFTDHQNLIREAIAALTRQFATPADYRGFYDSAEPFSVKLWQALAASGLIGVTVPEAYGGSGLGMVEAGCVLEALGGALASVPYLATAVVAPEIIRELGSDAQQHEWLPAIAEGRMTCCVLNTALPATHASSHIHHGEWAPVASASRPDLVLIPIEGARCEKFAALPGASPHLTITPMPASDGTRRFSTIRLTNYVVDEAMLLPKPLTASFAARLEALFAAGAAAEMLGMAICILDMATRYARDRHQFGQPIGAFQAIKHMLADQKVELEGLRSAVWAALWTLDHAPHTALVAAALAKVTADDVVVQAAANNIQIHGGMGFTADIDAHLYLKRAQLDRVIWGSSHYQQKILTDNLASIV